MIQKFLSNFESVDPKPTAFLEADDGETVVVTVEGVGKTKSGNELSGRSVWLYKVKRRQADERGILRRHGPGTRRAELTTGARPTTRYGHPVDLEQVRAQPCSGRPAVIAIRSPEPAMPCSRGERRAVVEQPADARSSARPERELTPKSRFSRRTVSIRGETASTGTFGRWAETRRAVRPLVGRARRAP